MCSQVSSQCDRMLCQKNSSGVVFLLATHPRAIATKLEISFLLETHTHFNKNWWWVVCLGGKQEGKNAATSQRKSFNHMYFDSQFTSYPHIQIPLIPQRS